MNKIVLLLVLGLFLNTSQAQKKQRERKRENDNFFKDKFNYGVPLAIGALGLGLAIENSKSTEHWWSNKYSIQKEVQLRFSKFSNSSDDYLRYAPIALAFGMNVAGQKSEHPILGQSVRLVSSYLLMDAVVNKTKKYTKHLRPSGNSNNSFPSQHTAQAFCAARFLDKEFGSNYPWIRWLGYSMAVGTGVFRVVNNAHWASDVLVGACVGMLSVDLTYWVFDKVKRKDKKLIITPMANRSCYGLNLVYRF